MVPCTKDDVQLCQRLLRVHIINSVVASLRHGEALVRLRPQLQEHSAADILPGCCTGGRKRSIHGCQQAALWNQPWHIGIPSAVKAHLKLYNKLHLTSNLRIADHVTGLKGNDECTGSAYFCGRQTNTSLPHLWADLHCNGPSLTCEISCGLAIWTPTHNIATAITRELLCLDAHESPLRDSTPTDCVWQRRFDELTLGEAYGDPDGHGVPNGNLMNSVVLVRLCVGIDTTKLNVVTILQQVVPREDKFYTQNSVTDGVDRQTIIAGATSENSCLSGTTDHCCCL
mmetsp:Transcript_46316/g.107785  ORF Transcript_46316/g.107785 Transcript_46316/m.107785 type:complete len:285 (-) Transcript_46316:754-1608(-)